MHCCIGFGNEAEVRTHLRPTLVPIRFECFGLTQSENDAVAPGVVDERFRSEPPRQPEVPDFCELPVVLDLLVSGLFPLESLFVGNTQHRRGQLEVGVAVRVGLKELSEFALSDFGEVEEDLRV